MTTQEFSNEFDVLYNNIMSNQAPGLNEYEKSVFLTKAQNEILKNYFSPKGNKYQEGFDGSPKRQIDFSSLLKAAQLTENATSDIIKIDERSKIYNLPIDILFILNETAKLTIDSLTRLVTITPLTFEEYSRVMNKPFKQPLKNQGWRLLSTHLAIDTQNIERISEIIVQNGATISTYNIRYIKRPNPIILTNLADSYSNVSIDDKTDITECELDPILHPEILQRAVELAKAAYVGDIKSAVELGQRSE